MQGRLAVASTVALACWLSGPVSAQQEGPLEHADRAYAEGRLAPAALAYEVALGTGCLDTAALVHAHLRLGVLTAMGGQDALAERHFALALALEPTRAAPRELDGTVRARFEALRAERDGRRLAVRLEDDGEARTVRVTAAPPGAVRHVVVRGSQGYEQRFAWAGEPIRVDAPDEALPLEALALDAPGNRLARAGARLEVVTPPAVAVPDEALRAEPAASGEGNGHSWFETPWLWIVVGLAGVGVGVAVGVSASGDRYVLRAPVIR
jgi:hypothetical protein